MKKKTILFLLLGLFLIGCGKKYPYTSNARKKEVIKNMMNLENEEKAEKAFEEQQKIINELKKLINQGDKKALEEYRKWEEIYQEMM